MSTARRDYAIAFNAFVSGSRIGVDPIPIFEFSTRFVRLIYFDFVESVRTVQTPHAKFRNLSMRTSFVLTICLESDRVE